MKLTNSLIAKSVVVISAALGLVFYMPYKFGSFIYSQQDNIYDVDMSFFHDWGLGFISMAGIFFVTILFVLVVVTLWDLYGKISTSLMAKYEHRMTRKAVQRETERRLLEHKKSLSA